MNKRKKGVIVITIVLFVILFLDFLRQYFNFSLFITEGYRNQLTQNCIIMDDTDYRPPWFNLFYIRDEVKCDPYAKFH